MNLKTFSTKEFEISLPETYIGGDPIKEKRAIKAVIKKMKPSEQSLFQKFFAQAIFTFMAADTRLREGQRGLTTCTVNTMRSPARYAKMSPQELLESMTTQLNGSTDMLEADMVEFSGFNAVRLITARRKTKGIFGMTIASRLYREEGEPLAEKSLTFIFTHAGKFISVIFSTEPEFFSDLLPVFEDSVVTLKIL